MSDNPFDRFDLAPDASPLEITETLRERIAEASPDEQASIRDAWELLTLDPRKRIALASATYPPVADRRLRPPPAPPRPIALAPARFRELSPLPSLGALLTPREAAPAALDPLTTDPLREEP